MHHSHEHSVDKSKDLSKSADPLPLRQDAPDLPACDPPQKDISKTRGGKIIDFIIYKVLGFAGNSGLSVGVTYYINPTDQAKQSKQKLQKGLTKIFGGIATERAINSTAEILFMIVSGTILTAVMAPLVNRRDKLAYWVNQKLGKDTDVLPDDKRVYNTPHTLEDKVEQELKKRVKYGQTAGDLWKARWTGVWVPIFGDPALSKWNDKRENEGKWSTDGLSWRLGQHLYDKVLHKDTVKKMGAFFTEHGAGIDQMKKNNKVVFNNLEKFENQHDKYNREFLHKPSISTSAREDRMMIADQTRLLGKEVGWTLVLSEIVERLTCYFQKKRIHKQERRAISKMREEGIIPVGIHVEIAEDGHVVLSKTKFYKEPVKENAPNAGPQLEDNGASKQWATSAALKQAPEKQSTSHAESALQRAQAAGAVQPSVV